MRAIYSLFLLIIVLSVSCQNKAQKDFDDNRLCIEFQYTDKHIFFPGMINDSVLVTILFDTGLTTSYSMISDSIRNILDRDSIHLQVGNFNKKIKTSSSSNNDPFFKFFGKNTICISWLYFEDKIIRISYRKQVIEELDNIANADGYTKIKIQKTGKNGLLIPIIAYIQNKKIIENIQIDTGSSESMTFGNRILAKYDIKSHNALHVTSMMSEGNLYKYFIRADSVKIGDLYTKGCYVGFGINKINMKLLGNEILERFDVILDLEDFYIYLKPEQEQEK